MADYIDREKLKRDLIDKGFYPALVKSTIENAPTEDVVPRSEYDDLKFQFTELDIKCNRLEKVEENYDKLEAELNKAKQEVSREIFGEIDFILNFYKQGIVKVDLLKSFDKLKSKYIGEN